MDSIQQLKTKQQKEEFLNSFDNFILDCDGVLWLGKEVIPGIPETIHYLRELGKKLYFITNNSTKSREQYIKKFLNFGIEVKKEEILSSAYLSALYIKQNFNMEGNKKVFLIGMEGLKHELSELNINYFCLDDNTEVSLDDSLLKLKPDDNISVVLAGMDTNINYSKYAYAHQCIKHGIPFLMTNSDKTYPLKGTNFPGTGAILSPIVESTGQQPIIIGKPSLNGINILNQQHQLNLNRSCMIGDRLDTDILFGKNANMFTLLVLSGVTDIKVLEKKENNIYPDFMIEDLTKILHNNEK
ncbi:putative 4-nitrophenylphosphatase [Neoconidiobolus thromboides FSU 785]|nr:putative 4-nitrophenylphosphatase [Neoconidiobolus thromboides FSU 785]